MNRPWMPLYIGDYLADTLHFSTAQHGAYLLLIMYCWQNEKLPADEETRAMIARMPLQEWQAIRGAIEEKFRPDGTHKRIETEIEKTEKKIMQRRIAGHKGGTKSGINRTLAAMHREATKQNASKPQAETKQIPSEDQAKSKQPATNHKVSIERGETSLSAGSLATALPSGALARQPVSESLSRIIHSRGWVNGKAT